MNGYSLIQCCPGVSLIFGNRMFKMKNKPSPRPSSPGAGEAKQSRPELNFKHTDDANAGEGAIFNQGGMGGYRLREEHAERISPFHPGPLISLLKPGSRKVSSFGFQPKYSERPEYSRDNRIRKIIFRKTKPHPLPGCCPAILYMELVLRALND